MALLMLFGSLATAADMPAGPQVGDDALLFSLPAVNQEAAISLVRNDHVSLGNLTGPLAEYPAEAVVLYFFSRDAGGDALGVLNRCQRKYEKANVRFVAIATDSGDTVVISDWVARQKLDYPVLRDNYQIVSSRYGVETLPWSYIIDGDGRIHAIGSPTPSELEAEVEVALGGLLED